MSNNSFDISTTFWTCTESTCNPANCTFLQPNIIWKPKNSIDYCEDVTLTPYILSDDRYCTRSQVETCKPLWISHRTYANRTNAQVYFSETSLKCNDNTRNNSINWQSMDLGKPLENCFRVNLSVEFDYYHLVQRGVNLPSDNSTCGAARLNDGDNLLGGHQIMFSVYSAIFGLVLSRLL
jgi:hypothetical protein